MSAIPARQLPDLEISWKFMAAFQSVPALFNEMTLRKREQAGIMIILRFKQNDLRLPGESYFDSTVRGSHACWQADSQHCAWQSEQCSTEAPCQAAVLLDVTHTAGMHGTRSCRAETQQGLSMPSGADAALGASPPIIDIRSKLGPGGIWQWRGILISWTARISHRACRPNTPSHICKTAWTVLAAAEEHCDYWHIWS